MMIGPADIEAWSEETEDRSPAAMNDARGAAGRSFAPPYRFAVPRGGLGYGLLPSAALRLWRDRLFGRLG